MSALSDYCLGDIQEMQKARFYVAILAEYLGTFLIMFIGLGSSCSGTYDFSDRMQVGLCYGIAVGASMAVFQHVSGGHFNPALTLAHIGFGRLRAIKGTLYVLFQFLAAIFSALLIKYIVPDAKFTYGITKLNGVSPLQGMCIEAIITFIYVMIFEACNDPGRPDMTSAGPVMTGFTVTACIIAFLPWTEGSLNPAKSLGIAIASQNYSDLWVYFVGPIAGAMIACILYKFTFAVGKQNDE